MDGIVFYFFSYYFTNPDNTFSSFASNAVPLKIANYQDEVHVLASGLAMLQDLVKEKHGFEGNVTILSMQRLQSFQGEPMAKLESILKYCKPHMDQMWAAKTVGIILDCDFRDSMEHLKKWEQSNGEG